MAHGRHWCGGCWQTAKLDRRVARRPTGQALAVARAELLERRKTGVPGVNISAAAPVGMNQTYQHYNQSPYPYPSLPSVLHPDFDDLPHRYQTCCSRPYRNRLQLRLRRPSPAHPVAFFPFPTPALVALPSLLSSPTPLPASGFLFLRCLSSPLPPCF